MGLRDRGQAPTLQGRRSVCILRYQDLPKTGQPVGSGTGLEPSSVRPGPAEGRLGPEPWSLDGRPTLDIRKGVSAHLPMCRTCQGLRQIKTRAGKAVAVRAVMPIWGGAVPEPLLLGKM